MWKFTPNSFKTVIRHGPIEIKCHSFIHDWLIMSTKMLMKMVMLMVILMTIFMMAMMMMTMMMMMIVIVIG